MSEQATAADFKKWSEAAAVCDLDSLRYVIQDCQEAAQAMSDWNPDRELYYRDQAMTYSDELRRRLASMQKDFEKNLEA